MIANSRHILAVKVPTNPYLLNPDIPVIYEAIYVAL